MMFLAILFAFSVCFLLILIRLIAGKTTYDRILAANSIGTIVVLAISIHGFYMGRPEFIDISIVYALINFIGTVAVLKLFDKGKLGDK
ncbi:MAG: pH regulation protein F [SAR116 cluster bacterium]|jgi:multicomponent Na+:H+ antiporter subunit F|nr:pH regulation protein F [SAR116 cluster bacterium]|tara:strand:- start:2346 stop:2609 length:264 start_codon:yes stop_codon:yes gene_type:complete